ncbi:hypothetical protein FG379_000459 [Cryptosporidium bovis]|uniref:uncharacterized protein n=1 Tax=Cryptosporidium bovis TaxID=310047 RepID=UPI00351A80F7|nr:hypothetical protein FG379_000459 [Cryptosporidium bovis]
MTCRDEFFYDQNEIYDGISRGKLKKKDLGWNIWLGIGFVVVINIWIIIYSSRLLKIVYTYDNKDNLMNLVEFETDITQFGYDIGELSLSILTFCIQESDPTLVNIPVRLGLSDQIVKQRYQVRNYLDTLNEIKLPRGMENKNDVIKEILARTSNLLTALVPLNIRFEDQPSPISPAPPPYYEPERTNITEDELKKSVESDSNTFLAAKYLCNNTDYILEESNYIMFKAMELSNPVRLFDFDYLNKFALENDYIKYHKTSSILTFHYLIIIIVVLTTFILFYFGAYDYFQKNNRLKMMKYSKLQISDILEKIIRIDGTNRGIIIDAFVPILKISNSIRIVCNGIIKEYGKQLGKIQINRLNEINNSIHEFENCVDLSIKYSEIMRDIVDNYNDNINSNDYFSTIDIIELIENDYSENFSKYNNHFFSKNINNKFLLSGNRKQFSEMLNFMIKSLGINERKSIYWDIITIKDNSFIPISMINSLGEIGKSVVEILSGNWNFDTNIENPESKSFLIIDLVLNKNIDGDNNTYNGYDTESRTHKITKYLNYMIAKRMAKAIFGGIIINNNNYINDNIDYNKTIEESELFNLQEFFDSQNMECNTLIIPLKSIDMPTPNSDINNVKHSCNNNEQVIIYACGIDDYYSNIFESVSRLLSFKYIPIDYWELSKKEGVLDHLMEKPGYWLFDVTTLDLFRKVKTSISNIKDYDDYHQNDIEMIFISISDYSIRVIFEFNRKSNFVDYYCKLKSLLNFGIENKPEVMRNDSNKDIEYDYRKIISLFNRPIVEIKPDLFEDINKLVLDTTENKKLRRNLPLINEKIFTLVNIQEMLASQMNENMNCSSKNEDSNNLNYEQKYVVNKPKELENSWKSIDVLTMDNERIKGIAEYLIHYRYVELIKDKNKYKEDITKWPININKIKRFVQELQNNYHEQNPFHNFHHVVSVSITLNQWLDKPSVKKYVNSLEAYCLVISSLGHDLDHPGLNNDLMKEIQNMYKNTQSSHDDLYKMLCEVSTISTLDIYNGISLLENHHTSLLFSILNNESCNVFPPFWSIYFEDLKKMVVNAILFTDMEYHKYIRNYLDNFIKYLENNKEDEHIYEVKKKFYLSSLLHSADISNPLMDGEIYLKWSNLIFQELRNQIRIKEMLNISEQEDSNFEDNDVKQQVYFIKYICIGYFESLNTFDTSILGDSIQNLYNNYDYYLNYSQ